MKRKAGIGLLILIAGAAGAVALGAQAQSPFIQNDRIAGLRHPDANRGRFVATGGEFGGLRFSCAQCHGAAGEGDASGAFPRLSGQNAWYLVRSLQDFASGVRPSKVMGPIAAELSHDQVLDVAAYYASLDDAPHPPMLPRSEDNIVRQGEKDASGALEGKGVPACGSCHGVKGGGNPPYFPFLAGQFQGYLEEQLREFRAERRGGDIMGVMHGIAAKLSNEDIHALAVYFSSLGPTAVANAGQKSGPPVRPPTPLVMQTGAITNPEAGHDKIVVPGAPPQSNP
jgi:cytochrome c553